MLLTAMVIPSVAFAEQSGADSAIASAKQQIVTCYDAAKAAEAAGANITSLTSILNDAGTLLSQAELAYSKNDFSTAQSLAVQSSQSLANFSSEANGLRDAAAQQRTFEFLVNVVGSITGTIAVIVAGFVVWRFLRKRQPQTGEQTDEPAGL
jgi:fluoride ion exporter CrcB/FEX